MKKFDRDIKMEPNTTQTEPNLTSKNETERSHGSLFR